MPNYVRIIIFALFFILYDPIFTSVYGGTIGHSKMGITVRNAQNAENKINFISALFRFIFKLHWDGFHSLPFLEIKKDKPFMILLAIQLLLMIKKVINKIISQNLLF